MLINNVVTPTCTFSAHGHLNGSGRSSIKMITLFAIGN